MPIDSTYSIHKHCKLSGEEQSKIEQAVVQAWSILDASNMLRATGLCFLLFTQLCLKKKSKKNNQEIQFHYFKYFPKPFSTQINSLVFYLVRFTQLLKLGDFLSWSLNMLIHLLPIQLKTVSTVNRTCMHFITLSAFPQKQDISNDFI